jgi:uncharacterized membrane protein
MSPHVASEQQPKISRNFRLLFLVSIILFGYFTRIIYVGAQSIWADEAFTYIITQSDHFWKTLVADVHPPLYFLLITAWTKIAGISELSLRMPSVLASTIALALIVPVTREVTRHRPHQKQVIIPIIAAFLLALSDLEVMVAQEARSYTLHMLFIMLSVWAYLRWIRTAGWRDGAAFVISNLLTIFTHYIGVFTPIAIGIHAIFFLRGKQRLTAISLLILSAILFLPWVLLVIVPSQLGKFDSDVVLAYDSTWHTLWYFRLAWLTEQWALMFAIFVLGLVIIHYQGERFTIIKDSLSTVMLLILWIAVPLALAFALNTRLPVLYDYRLTQITVAIMILIAYGLANLPRIAYIFLLAVLLLYGVSIVDVYRPKLPWREYSELVTDYVQEGQAVVSNMTGGDYVLDYYLPPRLPDNVARASVWQWLKNSHETYEDGLLGFIDSYDTIWIAQWSDNPDVIVKATVTGHLATMRRSMMYEGNTLEVLRYDRLPDSAVMTFDNGMILRHDNLGQGLVELWWTSEQKLVIDYIVSVKVLDANNQIIAQEDIQPQLGNLPSSTWEIGQIIYDPHQFDVNLSDYTIMLQVYEWKPDRLLLSMTETDEDYFILEP